MVKKTLVLPNNAAAARELLKELKPKLKQLDSEMELQLMMEFRREHWNEWVKFANENGYEPEIKNKYKM